MKTHRNNRRRQQGSILVVSLILAAIIGLSLGSYLTLAEIQDQSVERSQRWNTALDMSEAGIEEALAQMNANLLIETNNTPLDFSGNGWGSSASGVFGPMTRTLNNGSYSVAIVTNGLPIGNAAIYSTGYVTVPITGGTVTRVVKVVAGAQPLINVALGAINQINMNGGGMITASWNSHDPNLSDNGAFDPNKISTNGNVASVDGLINVGQHTIDGNVYLGPTASFVGNSNQVSGTIYNDYNVQFPDVVIPNLDWLPNSPNAQGQHYFDSSCNGQAYLINDSDPIIVDSNVTVTVKITTTDLNLSGSGGGGTITINGGLSNSGTLIMYQVSGQASLSGNTVAGGNRPENFLYFGAPDVTSISLSGTTTFIGVIYAPEATLKVNGGGSAYNVEGSCIVNYISGVNGQYNTYYDEALMTNGPTRGYIATSWQEL